MTYSEMYEAIQAMPLKTNPIDSDEKQIEKARTTIRHIIEKIERDQMTAYSAWQEAEENVANEDFEDLLERKYDEGYHEALLPVIRALRLFEETL